MKILITGGTGLIGRALCAALRARGDALTVLSRRPRRVTARCGEGVRGIASLQELRGDEGFDAVVNLAGLPIIGARWSAARKQKLWRSRVTLSETLVQKIAAANPKPKVLLSGSAVGVYGDCGGQQMSEASPRRGRDFGAKLCAAWEAAATKAEGDGVRVCLLRTGLVLSADGGMLARLRPAFRLGMGARLGAGTQWMSWIHIHDQIQIMLHLLRQTKAHGAFNLCAPQPVSNAIFTRALAKALHRRTGPAAPAWVLRATLGEMAGLLLGGQKALPQKITAQGYEFAYPQLDAALRDLLQPTSA